MRTEKLSAMKSDGKTPNVRKITNVLLIDKENPIEFKIPAEKFEYPQYDSLQEASQAAGGEDQLLVFLNRAARDAAVDAAMVRIRTGTTGNKETNFDDLIEEGLKLSRDWTPAKVERITAAETKKELDTLKTEIDNLTPEQLYERMKRMFGK